MEEVPGRARRFIELSQSRCVDLLTSNHVGRVAWQSSGGLEILPVSYAYHQGGVVFRTSPYGALSQLVQPTEVVMEVDDLDQTLRAGWSVVVRGRAKAVAEPREIAGAWSIEGVTPWASGTRNLFIRIAPTRITGRLLQNDLE